MTAIFENDSRRPNVTSNLTTGGYYNLLRTTKFPFDFAINANHARIDVCGNTAVFADYKGIFLEINRAFDRAIDNQVFFTRNIT